MPPQSRPPVQLPSLLDHVGSEMSSDFASDPHLQAIQVWVEASWLAILHYRVLLPHDALMTQAATEVHSTRETVWLGIWSLCDVSPPVPPKA